MCSSSFFNMSMCYCTVRGKKSMVCLKEWWRRRRSWPVQIESPSRVQSDLNLIRGSENVWAPQPLWECSYEGIFQSGRYFYGLRSHTNFQVLSLPLLSNVVLKFLISPCVSFQYIKLRHESYRPVWVLLSIKYGCV